MSIPFRLQVPRVFFEAMVAQALAEKSNECCGLLAGVVREGVGLVTYRYPLVNQAASGLEYLSDDRSILDAHKDMDRRELSLLVIYHSHPTTHPVPSKKDLERNGYGLWAAHAIIGLAGPKPEVRVWWLGPHEYWEAEWEVTDEL